jgi:2-phospho-L-lactate guanylyltransferase
VARTGPTAKSRLASVLSSTQRALLAQTMLADVLAACRAAPVAGIVAVVDGPQGHALATHYVPDPGQGMNPAVWAGIRSAARLGAESVIVLPGDVPLLTPADLQAVLDAAADLPRVVAVVPDRTGRGTNALLLRPVDVIRPSFGEDSGPRHLALARAAGAVAVCVSRPLLALDVDRPADLLDSRVQKRLKLRAAVGWSS